MDVNSLYADIDYEGEANACCKKLEIRKNKTVLLSTLKSFILLILKSIFFRFCNIFYLQKKGTVIGIPMATNYATLSMNMFVTLFLNEFHKKSGKKHVIWVRFIDDIFFIWTDGIDLLKEILPFCQKYSETKNMKSVIKLEISQSTKTINFLDVFITLKQLTLSTTVFPKSADAHICLNLKSCHPNI